MEKKTSRCIFATSKPLSSVESKKSQDFVNNNSSNGKLLSKSGARRREAAASSSFTNYRTYSKPTSSKFNTFNDKRPTNSSSTNVSNRMDGAKKTGLEQGQTFYGNSANEKQVVKENSQPFVNFVFKSHLDSNNKNQSRRRTSNNKRSKYTKENFLQANCQFIVNTSGDYRQYLHNPDAMVNWDSIEQINVHVSGFPSCPICLNSPIAAKITQCGHIYCWACILHYLALSDKPSRPCPICFAPVFKQHLKSVISIAYETFNINDLITFKLMKCAKGSLTVYPFKTDIMEDDDYIFNISEKKSKEVYSKLLLANQSDILFIIEREYNELMQQLIENGNCPENCFIDEALELLEQRKKILFLLSNNDIENDKSDCSVYTTTRNDYLNLDKSNINEASSSSNQKLHYFYQANGGQHVFLHAINAQMLEYTYGSLQFGPKEITGRILEKEVCSITEDLRKKRKYLQHLPVSCQFEVVEIQLDIPTVTEETLEEFSDQLERRRKKRQQRAKEEKRHEKRIAALENHLMGRNNRIPNLHIESEEQFPMIPDLDIISEDTSPPNSVGIENENVSVSFAKMLTINNDKTKMPVWPSLSSASKIDVVKPSWVDITKIKTNQSPIFPNGNVDSHLNMVDDDFELPVPVGNTSLADAFDIALRKNKKTKKKKNK